MNAEERRSVDRLVAVLEAFTRIPPERRKDFALFLYHHGGHLVDRSQPPSEESTTP